MKEYNAKVYIRENPEGFISKYFVELGNNFYVFMNGMLRDYHGIPPTEILKEFKLIGSFPFKVGEKNAIDLKDLERSSQSKIDSYKHAKKGPPIKPRENKIGFLNPKVEGHKDFADFIEKLGERGLMLMFPGPIEGVPTHRTEEGKELFDEISARALSMFENLNLSVSDNDMKRIILAALKMNGSYIVNKSHFEFVPSSGRFKGLTLDIPNPIYQPPKWRIEGFERTSTEKVLANVKNMERKKNADSPIHPENESEKDIVQRLNEYLEFSSAAWEKTKKVISENRGIASFTIRPNPPRSTAKNIKFSNILPIIDAVENPIMDALKKSGYTKMSKKDDARRFLKSDDNYFDVLKDGSMKSSPVVIGGDLKTISDDFTQKFLEMVEVYIKISDKYGKDLAFPSGMMDITIASENVDPKNTAQISSIKLITRDNIARVLSDPKYDSIRDKFTFEGKPLPRVGNVVTEEKKLEISKKSTDATEKPADSASLKIPNGETLQRAEPVKVLVKESTMKNTQTFGLNGPIPRKDYYAKADSDELRRNAIANRTRFNKAGK